MVVAGGEAPKSERGVVKEEALEGPSGPDAAPKPATSEPSLPSLTQTTSTATTLSTDPTATSIPTPPASNPIPAAPQPRPPPVLPYEDDFKTSPAMEAMIVSFLARMALLLGENKDPDMQNLCQNTLQVFSRCLRLWPEVDFNLKIVEKVLAATSGDPLLSLRTSLAIVNRVLEVQPHHLTEPNAAQLEHLLTICFDPKYMTLLAKAPRQEAAPIVPLICSAARRIFRAHPVTSNNPNPLAQRIQSKLQDAIQNFLASTLPNPTMPSAAPPQHILTSPDLLQGVCCALALLHNISEVVPRTWMCPFLPHLVKIINSSARELQATNPPTQTQQQLAARRNSTEVQEPEYGTVGWALCTILKLCAPRVLTAADNKKQLLHALVLLITGNGAKNVEGAIFLQMLKLLETWLLKGGEDPSMGTLSAKEAIVLLQRMAHLERTPPLMMADLPLKHAFEHRLLSLIYHLCTSTSVPEELRNEVFTKVERSFLLGMRAADPQLRASFFELYRKQLGGTLYDAFNFVFCTQEWEAMASHFYLKQAMDMIFIVLKDDDRIMLAPNSATMNPLLPGTAHNVYNPNAPAPPSRQPTMPPPPPSEDLLSGFGSLDDALGAGSLDVGMDLDLKDDDLFKIIGDDLDTILPDDMAGGMELEVTLPNVGLPGVDEMDDGTEGALGDGEPRAAGGEEGEGGDEKGPLIAANPRIVGLLQQHVEFLEGSATKGVVRELMASLTEWAHVDSAVAAHLWVLAFPIMWSTLEKAQQVTLAKPIINLMSKDFHLRQATHRPNVIQSMLEAISLSQPQPKIPPELIRYLARTFNCWHIAINLLESHVLLFPQEMRPLCALLDLYSQVQEQDMMMGLWRKRCTAADVTRPALSLVQYGMWDRAQELLGQANQRAANNTLQSPTVKDEQAMWVQQWVECCKALNMWEPLTEYARGTENQALQLQSLWRLQTPDWEGLKGLLLHKVQVEETPSVLMTRAYVALHAHDYGTVDKAVYAGMHSALQRWWQLPEIGSSAHGALLHQFQQLVELNESKRILMDVQKGAQQAGHPYVELKEITETWRLRTPNEWEPLTWWQDLLVHRNQVFTVLISAFNSFTDQSHQSLHQLGYRDRAWSCNQLGRIARKQGLPEVCLNILAHMYGYNAMEVQEAFVKTREQAKAYLDLPHDMAAGINTLNTTNLDYFGNVHQAEIFRLKGLFHQQLREPSEANTSFATALHLWRQCPEAWLSWGTFCDSRFEATRQAAAGSAEAAKQSQNMLESAVHCILQSVRLGCAAARNLLPRVLFLLSFDNDAGAVTQQLERTPDLPPWVWLQWIPQLLHSLMRATEAPAVKPLLLSIATHHPQAIYYTNRAFLLSMRDFVERRRKERERMQAVAAAAAAQAAGQASGASGGGEGGTAASTPDGTPASSAQQDPSSQAPPTPSPAASVPPEEDHTKSPEGLAFAAAREIMDVMRSRHIAITTTIEHFLSLMPAFTPKPQERMLSVVSALLNRCYKMPVPASAPVPEALRKELQGVCKACFPATDSGSAPITGAGRRNLREAFVRDLNPERSDFPRTLEQLAERLKAWRSMLLREVEDHQPGVLHLEDECKQLQEMALGDLEVFGQYLGNTDIQPDSLARVEALGNRVHVVRRSFNSARRLTLYASDGRTHHMLIQTGQNWISCVQEERMSQLARLLNALLDKLPESRRRSLHFHVPVTVTIHPQFRLVSDDPTYCTYGEAYEINCERTGREPDLPIIRFKQRIFSAPPGTEPDKVEALRYQAFQEIIDPAKNLVTENVFSQFMYKTLLTGNHVWAFKKHLCTQMALSSLLCHMLLLGGRTPHKILIARDSGRVVQMELIPHYGERGQLERSEAVPFRLTRNLSNFFTKFGVEGVFISALAAAGAAMVQRHTNLQHIMSLFFRDDLGYWYYRRSGNKGGLGAMKPELMKQLVIANMRKTYERARQVAPLRPQENEMPTRVVHQVAADLVEAAMASKYLCRMEPTWQPWF